MLSAPNDHDVLGRRDRAMLETLYSTGIRVSELVGINYDDLDIENEAMHVREARDARNASFLSDHTRFVRSLATSSCSRRGSEVWSDLGESRQRRQHRSHSSSTSTARGSPHALSAVSSTSTSAWLVLIRPSRRTHCVTPSQPTCLKMARISAQSKSCLGHQSLSTTQVYTHLSTNRVEDVYNQSHPRAEAS